jgi:hypothetical protein
LIDQQLVILDGGHMPNFSQKVPTPDPGSINTHCHAARVSTMREILGNPQMPLTPNCQNSLASAKVKALLVTRNVGPFSVTGISPFVDLLARVFARVKTGNPDLFNALATAGLQCTRLVRGSMNQPSNHSWGTAIDISIKNPNSGQPELDLPLNNGVVQLGCLELYKFFEQDSAATGEFCFWGAGFSREDGMHFEASDELIRKWKLQNRI